MKSHGIFRSMVWKDYRELRAFWIGTVLLAIALDALLGFMISHDMMVANYVLVPMLGWAVIMPAMYALGCAATMFAGERESGKYHFLRALPVNPVRLLWARTAFVLVTSLVMLVVTGGAFLVLKRWMSIDEGDVTATLGCFALTPNLEMFVWGVLFSLVCRRPITALILGGAFGGGMPLLVASQFHISAGPHETAADWWLPALAWRLAIVAIVAAVDVWLAAQWFRDEGAFWRPQRRLFRADSPTSSQASADSDRPSSTTKSTSEFGRLLWQQWRQSRRLVGVFGLVTLTLAALFVIAGSPHGDRQYPGALLALLLIPLVGVCVFREDWQEDRYRFLAERGASPGRVWLSRQLAWVPVAGLILAVAVAVVLATRLDDWGRGGSIRLAEVQASPVGASVSCLTFLLGTQDATVSPAEVVVLLVVTISAIWTLAAYACGQFCSIYTRSVIMAGMAAFGLLLAIAVWTGIMTALYIDWLWSVVPILLGLLLATRLRTRDWMLGRTDWRSRARAVAIPIMPLVAILAIIPFYRVYSVPDMKPNFPAEAVASPLTPEELTTARAYWKAYTAYVPLIASSLATEEDSSEMSDALNKWLMLAPSAKNSQQPIPNILAARLKANRKAIELTLQASRHRECAFGPHEPDNRLLGPHDAGDLGKVLVVSAKDLTAKGRLDAALDRYLAAIRVANHLAQCKATESYQTMWEADHLYRLAESQLLCWAAHPDQTAERIERALMEFTKLQLPYPSRLNQIVDGWEHDRRQLSQIDTWPGYHSRLNDPVENFVNLVKATALKRFPWERARSCRVVDYVARREYDRLQRAETAIRANGQVAPADLEEQPYIDALVESTSFPDSLRSRWAGWRAYGLASTVTRDRAFRLQLALVAWRLKHGDVPKSLDELVGTYLDAVPVDPFTGEPFRYFPEGVPRSVIEEHPNARYHPAEGYGPLLWSPAGRVVVAEDGQDEFFRARGRSGFHHQFDVRFTSLWEMLQAGQIFPVP